MEVFIQKVKNKYPERNINSDEIVEMLEHMNMYNLHEYSNNDITIKHSPPFESEYSYKDVKHVYDIYKERLKPLLPFISPNYIRISGGYIGMPHNNLF